MSRGKGRKWVYADPHFFHRRVVTFDRHDGEGKLRPRWAVDAEEDDDVIEAKAEEMTMEMIEWFNELVAPNDRVYLLGDISFTKSGVERSLPLLNGHRIFNGGNHDRQLASMYLQWCEDVRAMSISPKNTYIMSHIPFQSECVDRWGLNIHGHLHDRRVMKEVPTNMQRCTFFTVPGMNKTRRSWPSTIMESVPDPRYQCVSVEQTNFRPMLLDEVLHKAELERKKEGEGGE